MSGILACASIALLAVVISLKTKREWVSSIPVSWCVLMLVLQLLCCFNRLHWIDGISYIFLVLAGGYVLAACKNRGGTPLKEIFWKSSTIVYFLMIIGVVVLNRYTMVASWDDVNYWAASTRAIFERNGLEGKYLNVGSGWGDYPLGQQLIEWWFVHSFSGDWQEKLLFIGYQILLCSFVVPFFTFIKFRIVSIAASALISLVLIHIGRGAAQILNADVLLGIMYGYCVYYILQITREKRNKAEKYDLCALSILLAGVAMIKSIGILWSILAMVIYYLLRGYDIEVNQKRKLRRKCIILLLPMLVACGFWRVVCIAYARNTYLVNLLVYAQVISIKRHVEQAFSFCKAVMLDSAISWNLGGYYVGLSLGTLILVPCLLFIYVRKHRIYEYNRFKVLSLYTIGVFIGYFVVLLYAYETMFVYEFQTDSTAMVSSLLRYLTPCIILVRVVLWEMYHTWPAVGRDKWYVHFAIGLIIVSMVNTGALSKQMTLAFAKDEAYEKTRGAYEERYAEFYEQLFAIENRMDVAVCYFDKEMEEYDRIHLNYLAQGTAVNLSRDMEPESVRAYMHNSHGTHAVICRNDLYSEADYQCLMQEGNEFEFDRIYVIVNNGEEPVYLRGLE